MNETHVAGIYTISAAVIAVLLTAYLKGCDLDNRSLSVNTIEQTEQRSFLFGRPAYRHNEIEQAGISYSDYMKIFTSDPKNGLEKSERLNKYDGTEANWTGFFVRARVRNSVYGGEEIRVSFAASESESRDQIVVGFDCILPMEKKNLVSSLTIGEKINCRGRISTEGMSVTANRFEIIE
ncbi:hypothetical protein [Salinisphaera sp.]|uniref:hypothetical protein n=1 Tax=Salinisphaera sp. TaxID=1914330 RepID=UPI0025FA6EBA|nr:hypothetical protein [Salinisphaera sp.]